VEDEATPAALGVVPSGPLRAVTEGTRWVMDAARQSASLFLLGFGGTLMATAVLANVSFGTQYHLAHLRSGEFVALLLCGLLLLLVGAGYRMYSGWVKESAARDRAAWIRDRATIEANAQLERTTELLKLTTEPPSPASIGEVISP
jgi:hypothetical protein